MMRVRGGVLPGIAIAGIVLAVAGVWQMRGGDEAVESGAAAERSGASSAAVELGGALYTANCAACHGGLGEGQPNWQQRGPDGVLPAPPHDETGHTWHHGDGTLFRVIRDGGAQYAGPTTPSGMPAFGEQLSDEEIRAVVLYLKSFWGADEQAFQQQVSADDPMP